MVKQKIGYIRVSSQRQEDGLSIDNQRSRLLAAGCDLVLVDIKTGRTANRESYQKMLTLIKEGEVAELVAIRIDRIGRSTIEILRLVELLQKYRVRLHLLDENFDFNTAAGEMFLTNLASFAQFTSRQLTEKQRSVHAYKRSHGMAIHSPFGYKYEDGQLLPDDSLYGDTGKTRWEIACELIELFLENGTLRGTVRKMGDRHGFGNHPIRSDFPSTAFGLRRWLLLPTLRGHTNYPNIGKVIQNTHPALIGEDVDYQIRALIERSRSRRGYGAKANEYPLSGLIYCACGARCSIGLGGAKEKGQHRYAYYGCDAHKKRGCTDQPPDKRRRGSIRLEVLEGAVIQALVSRGLAIAEYVESSLVDSYIPPSPEIIELENQINHLRQVVNGPGGAIVRDALEQLEVERDNLLIAQQPNERQGEAIAQALVQTASDPDFWQEIDTAKKRVLFHWLIKKIVIRGSEILAIELKV